MGLGIDPIILQAHASDRGAGTRIYGSFHGLLLFASGSDEERVIHAIFLVGARKIYRNLIFFGVVRGRRGARGKMRDL